MLVTFTIRVLIELCDPEQITKSLSVLVSHCEGLMVYMPQRGLKELMYITLATVWKPFLVAHYQVLSLSQELFIRVLYSI